MAADGSSVIVGAAAAASSAGSAAAMSGMPPQDVIIWSLIGGLVSVWASRTEVVRVTLGWLASVVAHIGVSASSGIALSAILQAVAPKVGFISALADVPRWASAAIFAAVVVKVAPVALKALQRAITRVAGGSGGSTPNGQ